MSYELLNGEKIVSKDYIDLINKIINDLNTEPVTRIESPGILLSVKNDKYGISCTIGSPYCTIITRDDKGTVKRLEIENASALLTAIYIKYYSIRREEKEKTIKETLQAIS